MKVFLCGLLALGSWASAQSLPSGWVQLVNQQSGKCLDIKGGTSAIAPGIAAQQWTCGGASSTNQLFRFVPVTGGYKILVDNSGLALQPQSGNTADKTPIIQAQYMGDSYQIWDVMAAGNGYYTVRPTSAPSSCLDDSNQSTANGNPMWEAYCWGGINLNWKPVSIAVQNPVHTVAMNWKASTSSGVTGYNVYRATGSGTQAKIASVTTLNYTDTTVVDGQTYTYAVTAIDSTGDESTDSNIAAVTVPST